ncbi:MAG: hypothetical protein KFH98_14510 [Gemmatimonadetes bacterium]|nr:hypothetical protein [Gemmatimonadota bacterium]
MSRDTRAREDGTGAADEHGRVQQRESDTGDGAADEQRVRHPAPGIEHQPEPDAENIIPAKDKPGTL